MARTCRLCYPSGFGEILIFWSKLGSAQRLAKYADLTWEAEICRDDIRGSEQLVPCLPNVRVLGVGKHTTAQVLQNALPGDAILEDHIPGPIYVTTDHWLLRGNSISDWLPELPTDFHYPIWLPPDALDYAKNLTGDAPYLLIHPSSLWRTRLPGAWSQVWGVDQWADLCVRLDRSISCPWYLIGSNRDRDMMDRLLAMGAVPANRLLMMDRLANTMALVRRASYVVSFPAGPGVLAGVFNVAHCMPFRFELQRHMVGKFTDPKMIEDGRAYLPFFTETPAAVAGEIINRLPAAMKQSGAKLLPAPHVPGVEVRENPDVYRLLEPAAARFNQEHVFGALQGPGVDLSHCRYFYALGQAVHPRTVLELGSDGGYSAASMVAGTLDAGVPVSVVSLVDVDLADRTERFVKFVGARSSRKLDIHASVDSKSDRKISHPGIHDGYVVVHINGRRRLATLADDLQFAYKLLSPYGTLVVSGTSDPAVRLAYQAFAADRGYRPSLWPVSSGWGVIQK